MDCADNDLDDVPSFSTGSTFLDANAQAHHKPLSAFGDSQTMLGSASAEAPNRRSRKCWKSHDHNDRQQ